MAKLSSAAWIAHDVGLATAIGGTMFGREALQPALEEISDRAQRALVAQTAWRRFSWINLAGHAAVAATWFFGRTMVSGHSVSPLGRRLTLAKDALVVASLVTGVSSMILGRMLGAKTASQRRVVQPAIAQEPEPDVQRLQRAVGALGMANLAANLAIAGVTTALAMEASQSPRFTVASRRLP